jgi:hypothetical protein
VGNVSYLVRNKLEFDEVGSHSIMEENEIRRRISNILISGELEQQVGHDSVGENGTENSIENVSSGLGIEKILNKYNEELLNPKNKHILEKDEFSEADEDEEEEFEDEEENTECNEEKHEISYSDKKFN